MPALAFLLLPGACPSPTGPDGGPDGGSAGSLDAGLDAGADDGGADDAGADDAGAGGDAGGSGDGGVPILRLDGTASGDADAVDGGSDGGSSAGSDRAECALFIDVIDVVITSDGFTGTAVGEVFRTVFEGEARYEFSAFVAGPASLSAGDGGTVLLSVVGEQPEDAAPFWLEIERLVATPDAEELSWSGTWLCAPLNIDEEGFKDSTLTVPGTFTLAPLEDAP